jgi:hypothetical protein
MEEASGIGFEIVSGLFCFFINFSEVVNIDHQVGDRHARLPDHSPVRGFYL